MTTFTSEDRENAVKNNASQQTFDTLKQSRIVAEAPYHPGYEDAVVDQGRPLSQVIRENMRASGKRFWAGDNINEFIKTSFYVTHLKFLNIPSGFIY